MQMIPIGIVTTPNVPTAAQAGNTGSSGGFGDLLTGMVADVTGISQSQEGSDSAQLLGMLRLLLVGMSGQGASGTQLSAESEVMLPSQVEDKLEQLDGQLERLLEDEGFMDWLLQASELLAALNGNTVPATPVSVQGEPLNGKTASVGPAGQSPAEVLAQFIEAFKQQPHNPFLQQLAAKLEHTFASLSAGAINGFAAAPANEMAGAGMAGMEPQSLSGKQGLKQERMSDIQAAAEGTSKEDLLGKEGAARLQTASLLSRLEAMGQRPVVSAMDSGVNAETNTESSPSTVDLDPQPVQLELLAKQEPGKAAQLVVKTDGTPVPVQQFAKELDTFLVKTFQTTTNGDFAVAKLSLAPEHLGQVDIKITIHNGQLVAQFTAQSGLAKDLLESQMAQLRASLVNQGMQVDRLEVTQQSAAASFAFQEQGRQSQQQSAKQGNGQSNEAFVEEAGAGEALADFRQVVSGSEFDTMA